VRRILVLVLLAFLAAGCGGSETPDDPGREVVDELITAAAEGDTEQIWDLLSTSSRTRAGTTLDAFRDRQAVTLRRQLAPFAGGYRVLVSERISDRYGVVGIRRGDDVYAAPLRLEDGRWRVELPGPVKIDVLGPRPGAREPVGQIGVEVRACGGVGTALLYLDGLPLSPNVYSGPRGATVFANLTSMLKRGPHDALAYADLGDEAAATAWTFTAR
jgi:hypothetical protein